MKDSKCSPKTAGQAVVRAKKEVWRSVFIKKMQTKMRLKRMISKSMEDETGSL